MPGGGGLTATGLVVLLLAIIGIGVGLYYAYICLRARPLRPESRPTDSEHGPLISPDPDVNGNHEDVPLEASAPVDEGDPEKIKKRIDEPDGKKDSIDPSTNDTSKDSKTPNGYPKEREESLLPVKEELTPAKITLENETVPVINHAAPIGLVAPLGLVAPSKIAPTKSQPPEPEKVPIPQKSQAETKKPQESHPPTSASSPAPVYVPVPLVVAKKPVSDSDEEDGLLLPKCSPHDDSLDPDQCPELTAPAEPTKATPVPSVEDVPAKESKPSQPLKPSPPTQDPVTHPAPEKVPENPHAVKPEIMIAPDPEVAYGWKENEAPLKRAPEATQPAPKVEEKPTAPLMKEEVENLQPVPVAANIEELDDPVEPIFEVKDISRELNAAPPVKEVDEKPEVPKAVKSNEKIPTIVEPVTDVPTETSDDSVEYPPVVYLETCQPNQELRPTSGCSASSEEILPPYPQSAKTTPTKDEEREESPVTPEVDDSKHESIDSSSVTPVSSSSDTIKAPVQTNSQVPVVMSSVPLSDADVPLEAYIPNLSDDDNSLAVIKEEGSTCTESETESSEPEVTEYSFSSGPTAPTTSEILADEVSCSMEPEVTKYSIISDAEPQLPGEESESSDDEVSMATNPTTESSDKGSSNPKPCEPDSSTNQVLTAPSSNLQEEEESSVTASTAVCTQLADSTNTPSHASLSSSEESEGESEGAEAEMELREEVVEVPTALQNESCESLSATSSDAPTSTSQTEPSASSDSKTEGKKNGTLVTVADSADSDVTSTSTSSSSSPCSSDLSDDEVTTSTPKKSKIPRLVSHQESSV